MPMQAPGSQPIIRFNGRREAFCQHVARGAGGAEAARRAGFSPRGAKQRGCYLLSLPEIRLRVDKLRAELCADHQSHLDAAIVVVGDIIADAMQNSKCSVALKAVEFQLKLRGVIRDKAISLYSYSDKPSPDADLEKMIPDPLEDLDGLPGRSGRSVPVSVQVPVTEPLPQSDSAAPINPAPASTPEPAPEPESVTFDDVFDLPPVIVAPPQPAGDAPPKSVGKAGSSGNTASVRKASPATRTRDFRPVQASSTKRMTLNDLLPVSVMNAATA